MPSRAKIPRASAPRAAAGPAEPRWNRRKDARPAELIDAAFDLFVERGFAATRLDDVARRAGVTKGTLYLYFPSKEALFEAVVRAAAVPNLAQVEQMIAAHDGDMADLLRTMLGFWWTNVGATRVGALPKLIFAEAANFPELCQMFHDEIAVRAQALIAGIVRRGIERGEFRPCDPAYVARLVMAPMVFHTLWSRTLKAHEKHPLDDRRFIATHVDLLLDGLRAKEGNGHAAR